MLDFRRAFNRAVLARVTYEPSDTGTWMLKLRAVHNTDDGDSYVEPSVTWCHGNLAVALGAGFIDGPVGSFWGGYSHHDRVFCQAIWQF